MANRRIWVFRAYTKLLIKFFPVYIFNVDKILLIDVVKKVFVQFAQIIMSGSCRKPCLRQNWIFLDIFWQFSIKRCHHWKIHQKVINPPPHFWLMRLATGGGLGEELDHSHSWRMKRQLRRSNLSWDILKTPPHSSLLGPHHSPPPPLLSLFLSRRISTDICCWFLLESNSFPLLTDLNTISNVLRASSLLTFRLKFRLSEWCWCTLPENFGWASL